MSSTYCEAVREFSLESRLFFIRYRLSAILVGLTMVNVLLRYMEKNVVTKFSTYKNYSAETNQMMGVRFVQLLFGLIVGIGGYGTLLFNGISGCDASELYLFYFGGVLLLFLDLHEYVRSWPLRAPILGHHLMVFFFGLAIIEYDLIPSPNDSDPRITLATMLLVANIGLMWITDFFHVVFRVSMSLPLIERYRKIYLVTSIIRPITLGLMIYGAVEAIIEGSIAAALPMIFLAVAYAYNLVKAIQFVYLFDCEKYFLSHQAKWVRESLSVDIEKEDIRTRRLSLKHKASNTGVDEEISQGNLKDDKEEFTNRRTSFLRSFKLEDTFDSLFAIDVNESNFNVMEGLRGDAAIDGEMEKEKTSLQHNASNVSDDKNSRGNLKGDLEQSAERRKLGGALDSVFPIGANDDIFDCTEEFSGHTVIDDESEERLQV